MQVCRAWRQALDLPQVWRKLCRRDGLVLEGEQQGVQEEQEVELGEEGVPRMSFWPELYRARSWTR